MPSTPKARRSCRKFLAPRSTNSCRPSASKTSRKRLRESAPAAGRTKEFNRSKRKEQRSGATRPRLPLFPPVQSEKHESKPMRAIFQQEQTERTENSLAVQQHVNRRSQEQMGNFFFCFLC